VKIHDRVQLVGGHFGHIVEFPGPAHAVVELVPDGRQVVVHKEHLRECRTPETVDA